MNANKVIVVFERPNGDDGVISTAGDPVSLPTEIGGPSAVLERGSRVDKGFSDKMPPIGSLEDFQFAGLSDDAEFFSFGAAPTECRASPSIGGGEVLDLPNAEIEGIRGFVNANDSVGSACSEFKAEISRCELNVGNGVGRVG